MGARAILFILFSITLSSCLSMAEKKQQVRSFYTGYFCPQFNPEVDQKRNWRSVVLEEITENKYPQFLNPKSNSDLIKFCPNFMNLSNYEKKVIWLRIIDGIVYYESTCKPTARAHGPNGIAYGLMQLHLGREQDYQRYCNRYDSKTPGRTLICGLNMLHEQLDQYKDVFFSGSYWDVLRPKGVSRKAKSIASHLWYFPKCHANNLQAPPFKK